MERDGKMEMHMRGEAAGDSEKRPKESLTF